MSVTESSTVDAIGIDLESGEVKLTITDPLDWSAPKEHMLKLQDKLNGYLAFIESGELLKTYPDAAGRKVRIKVDATHAPDPNGAAFIAEVAGHIEAANIAFTHAVVDPARAPAAPKAWPFDVRSDAMVLTTRAVTEAQAPVLEVLHDKDEDGVVDWQFLDGKDDSNPVQVRLREVLTIDPELEALADLPLGYVARRKSAAAPWIVEPDASAE